MPEICRELGIEDVNTTKYSKYDYKKILSTACHAKNEVLLRKMAEGKEKCSRMAYEPYGQKCYIEEKNISDVRNTYRSRFGQRAFAGNFSHDNKYSTTNWMCKCENSKEKEKHITSYDCPVYSDIRAKYPDFDRDEDLVSYFNEVLERRDMIDSMEKDEKDFYG